MFDIIIGLYEQMHKINLRNCYSDLQAALANDCNGPADDLSVICWTA